MISTMPQMMTDTTYLTCLAWYAMMQVQEVDRLWECDYLGGRTPHMGIIAQQNTWKTGEGMEV